MSADATESSPAAAAPIEWELAHGEFDSHSRGESIRYVDNGMYPFRVEFRIDNGYLTERMFYENGRYRDRPLTVGTVCYVELRKRKTK